MKTCPICKARCFDDMEICYGCMHRFTDDAESAASAGDYAASDAVQLGEERSLDSAASPVHASAGTDEDAEPRRANARRDSSRVFGAMGDADDYMADSRGPSGYAPGYASGYVARNAYPAGEYPYVGAPLAMLKTGPIATASLGGGYRLVVSIERE